MGVVDAESRHPHLIDAVFVSHVVLQLTLVRQRQTLLCPHRAVRPEGGEVVTKNVVVDPIADDTVCEVVDDLLAGPLFLFEATRQRGPFQQMVRPFKRRAPCVKVGSAFKGNRASGQVSDRSDDRSGRVRVSLRVSGQGSGTVKGSQGKSGNPLGRSGASRVR